MPLAVCGMVMLVAVYAVVRPVTYTLLVGSVVRVVMPILMVRLLMVMLPVGLLLGVRYILVMAPVGGGTVKSDGL